MFRHFVVSLENIVLLSLAAQPHSELPLHAYAGDFHTVIKVNAAVFLSSPPEPAWDAPTAPRADSGERALEALEAELAGRLSAVQNPDGG